VKRFIKFLLAALIIVSISFGIYKFKNSYDFKIINKDINLSIKVKGLKDARSFDFDDEGNLYIAFEDTLKIINKNGNNDVIIRDSKFDILDILYYKNKLYIATDNRILEYDLTTNNYKELVINIPNQGMNKKVNLLLKDDKLYFAIGSNTNDGIVNKKGEAFEIPTNNWILVGDNYGEAKTGAFSPYSISSEKGQTVEGKVLGNAAIITYDLKTEELSLFSHGIRNIAGWDISSEDKIIAIVGGMLDTTVRGIKNDKDYIYEINGDRWYGWPDYSGGDPISSPRFTDGEPHKFLIKNHISNNPDAPIYQYKDVAALNGLAIDKEGKYFEKDTLIVSDNKSGDLYSMSPKGNLIAIANLGDESKIEKIKFCDEGFYILDSGFGSLYTLNNSNFNKKFNLPYVIWAFIITFIIILISVILIKNKRNEKKVK